MQGVTDVQALQGNDVYRPFWRKEFFDAIRALDVDLTDYLFIDIGSGKGKLLLLASQFPFSGIVGIEYAPALHATAVNNIKRFRNKAGRPDIMSVNADAMTWELPTRPAVYFCTIRLICRPRKPSLRGWMNMLLARVFRRL